MSLLSDVTGLAIQTIADASGVTLSHSTSPSGPWTPFVGYFKCSSSDAEYSDEDEGNSVTREGTLTTLDSVTKFDRGHYVRVTDSEGSNVWAITARRESQDQAVYPNMRRHTIDARTINRGEYR